MANIKSAKKRIKVIEKKTLQNKMVKSQMKTATKKVVAAANAADKAAAKETLINAMSTIDKARSKGVLHRKTASRKIARLSKLVNKVEA